MKKPAAILFDLDDTILGSEGGDHLSLWKSCVDDYIHHFPALDAPVLFNEIRQVADKFWGDPDRHRIGRLDIRTARQNIVIKSVENLDQSNKKAALELADHYHHRREYNTAPFEGALETLQYFQRQPIKMALITNGASEVQRAKIDKHELEPFFDLVLVEGEFGAGKPDPSVYHHILASFDVRPEESWIVGDNLEWEVRVPQELGMNTVWHDAHNEGLPGDSSVQPDLVVHRISELVELFSQ